MKKILLAIILILTLIVSACSLEQAPEEDIDKAINELSDKELDALMINEDQLESSSLAGQAVKSAKTAKSAATLKVRKKVKIKVFSSLTCPL